MIHLIGAYKFQTCAGLDTLNPIDIAYYIRILSIQYASFTGIYRVYYPRIVTAINSEGFSHYKRPVMPKIYR